MFPYGKTASNGVAAMSYLAERYQQEGLKVSSTAIAKDRNISKALVSKVLTVLSQAGLVGGSPGPGGGYFLAKPPSDISLMDIVCLFEKVESDSRCPFGPHWCGNGDPCPIHDQIVSLSETTLRFLNETSLEVFVLSQQD
jgi:Rrf2 family protein